MAKNCANRDRRISQFMPDSPLPPCELCQTFPIILRKGTLISRFDRRIAKLSPGRRGKKLERLRHDVSRSDAITLYLHGDKKLFTLPMLKSAIPDLTAANWTSVRDYIFYGPQRPPTPGPGRLFCILARWFCTPKTMHSIVLPSIADLRLEYSEAVRQGRFASAMWIRVRASWDFVRMLALSAWRKAA
jgi:hypothetical protein